MFDKLSIRSKLLVLLGLSLGTGLLVSALVALYATFAAERQSSLRVLHQVAAITSENLRAALAFHDLYSATKILEPLHTNPHILYALVTDEHGTLLGQYQARTLPPAQATRWHEALTQHGAQANAPAKAPPPTAPDGVRQGIQGAYHYVIYPIDFEGQRIGSLALLADNAAMYAKMRHYVWLQLGATALIFLSLLLLSWRLQLIFTRPILELIASMRRIGQSKDYTTVLTTHHADEFRELYQGFNAMLQEVRVRDEKLSQLASTDALTGLANRGHALEALQRMAAHAQRAGTPLGVILLDVDFFKRVNDNHGHAAGDQVLQGIAHLLHAHIRPYDIAARWGGEEFLVLCDGADLATTARVAERIRASVANHTFTIEGQPPLQVTISLGIHASTAQPDAPLHLVAQADQALYRAKQAGRNRVECAQGD